MVIEWKGAWGQLKGELKTRLKRARRFLVIGAFFPVGSSIGGIIVVSKAAP